MSLGNRGRKEIKFVAPAEEKPTTQTFSGPEVRIMMIILNHGGSVDSSSEELTPPRGYIRI